MTVAVKYCGGCNTRYDRSALVVRLLEDFPQMIPIGPGVSCPDLALIVCGCSSRCAEHNGFDSRYGKIILSCVEDGWQAREKLSRILGEETRNGRNI